MPKTDDDPNANPWFSIDFHTIFVNGFDKIHIVSWATFNFSTHKC